MFITDSSSRVCMDEETCNSNSAQQYLLVLDFQGQLTLTNFLHFNERYLPNKDSLFLSSGITSERFVIRSLPPILLA